MVSIKSRVASRLKTTAELDEIIAVAESLSQEITRKQESATRASHALGAYCCPTCRACQSVAAGTPARRNRGSGNRRLETKVTYGAALVYLYWRLGFKIGRASCRERV